MEDLGYQELTEPKGPPTWYAAKKGPECRRESGMS